jgi:hypothetical protein
MTGKSLTDNQSGGPACKRKTIGLELKIKIKKTLKMATSLSGEYDLAISTVKPIFEDSECMKNLVKVSGPLKFTIIMKKHTGALFEMEQ